MEESTSIFEKRKSQIVDIEFGKLQLHNNLVSIIDWGQIPGRGDF